jgi:hypothetical protein
MFTYPALQRGVSVPTRSEPESRRDAAHCHPGKAAEMWPTTSAQIFLTAKAHAGNYSLK